MPEFSQPSKRFPPHPICNFGSWVLRKYFRILGFRHKDVLWNELKMKWTIFLKVTCLPNIIICNSFLNKLRQKYTIIPFKFHKRSNQKKCTFATSNFNILNKT